MSSAASKRVVVAGATGLVGHAAIRCFLQGSDCEVIAISRRRPEGIAGSRFMSVDLGDARSCAEAVAAIGGVTHLVYAALHERPGLLKGWSDQEQIALNDRMLRNLLGPLEKASPPLRHVLLMQGGKAYGSHVRPVATPAREGRSEMYEQPNYYWQHENYVRELQQGKSWRWTILRPQLIFGVSLGSAMNVLTAIGVYAALSGATSLDFGENFVDDDVLRHRFAQSGVKPLKELRDGLVIAAHERDAGLLPLGSQHRTTDRRDLADRDLTASIIQKGLDVIEGCDV
jgi:nucleoside-diphosphate-sugar epimerase